MSGQTINTIGLTTSAVAEKCDNGRCGNCKSCHRQAALTLAEHVLAENGNDEEAAKAPLLELLDMFGLNDRPIRLNIKHKYRWEGVGDTDAED